MLSAALALALLGAAPEPPLPEGNAYVKTLVARHKLREEALDRYTYEVEQLVEELDGEGKVASRKLRRYEVFYVRGRPVRKLVAEDGRPLPPGEREAEERRVGRKVGDLVDERVVFEDAEVRLSAILERYDFRTVRREELDGWPALVLEFAARPGKRDLDGDAVLRHLAGRIWVDETEGEVVRAEVRNASTIKLALGVGASIAALEMTLDFRRIEDGLWMPARAEALAEGRILLLKSFRGRSTTIFSRFRRFEATSEERVQGPASR